MKTAKRSIYLRILAGLAALWFIFFIAFSLYEIHAQREKELREVYQQLSFLGNDIEGALRDWEDTSAWGALVLTVPPQTERDTQITRQLNGYRSILDAEFALYDNNRELICQSGDYIPVHFTVPNKHTYSIDGQFMGTLDLKNTLPEDAQRELKQRLYPSVFSPEDMDPYENGDIVGYCIYMTLWTDGTQIIPNSIYAYPQILVKGDGWMTPVRANSIEEVTAAYDENGNVEIWVDGYSMDSSSTTNNENNITVTVHDSSMPKPDGTGGFTTDSNWNPEWVYTCDSFPAETEGMILTYGYLYQFDQTLVSYPELQAIVRDQELLSANLEPAENCSPYSMEYLDGYRLVETKGFFETKYHVISKIYYQEQINASSSPFHYLVTSGYVHPLRDSLKTISAVATGSLLLFLLVGLILCNQLGKTYEKERALEAQRRRTTNAIAHDLKTPMAAILGLSENLVEHTKPKKEAHYIKSIQTQALRMNDIVTKMLELSRLEAGVDTLNPETFQLKPLCQQAIASYSDTGQMFCITGNAEITADREMLLRVLDNLLSNGVKHTTPGNLIEVILSPCYCAVKNPGEPIPEDELPHLFEAYYQADRSRSSGGSGLGLAIVKEILDRHRFAYGVENQKGFVTFWFSWE